MNDTVKPLNKFYKQYRVKSRQRVRRRTVNIIEAALVRKVKGGGKVERGRKVGDKSKSGEDETSSIHEIYK